MANKKALTEKINKIIYKSGNAQSKKQQTKVKRGGVRMN